MPTAAATLPQSRPNRLTAVLNLFSSPSVHTPSPPVALAFLVASRFSTEAACDAKTDSRDAVPADGFGRGRADDFRSGLRAVHRRARRRARFQVRSHLGLRRGAHVDTRRRRVDDLDAGRRACRAGDLLAMVSARFRSASNVLLGCFILPPSSQSGTL